LSTLKLPAANCCWKSASSVSDSSSSNLARKRGVSLGNLAVLETTEPAFLLEPPPVMSSDWLTTRGCWWMSMLSCTSSTLGPTSTTWLWPGRASWSTTTSSTSLCCPTTTSVEDSALE
jgi:hypothetical protein